MSVSTKKLAVEPGYHNPSPLVWIIDHANEAMAVIEGMEIMSLVDTGSQISTLTKQFCTEFGLRILLLRSLVCLRGPEVFQYDKMGTQRLTSLYQGLPSIMRTCYL